MRLTTVVLMVLLAVASAATAAEKGERGCTGGPGSVPGPLDCTNAIPIGCGDSVEGDNTGMPNSAVCYSCVIYAEDGGEVVYELVISGPECYEITVSMVPDGNSDLDLFFLGSCDELDCLYYSATTGPENLVTDCIQPGTYYIVVDGYQGAEAPFTLTVDCVECDCLGPPCCPNTYDCYVLDFNQFNTYTVIPCDGASCWEWGPPVGIPEVSCDDVPVTNVLGTVLTGDYPADAGEIAVVGPFPISVDDCYCMEICHYYDIQTDYDGGNVKVSTNGGTSWTLVTPAGRYPDVTYYSPRCVPIEPAYTGHPEFAFIRDCFDLSAYDGMDILVGFFFGSDGSQGYPGWYIKWVKIGGEAPPVPVDGASWGSIKSLYR
jgi:hypothetical protein